MKTFVISLLIIGLPTSPGHAATGFTFLQLGADVRASGLGGISTALSNHTGGLFGNPSGMAGLTQKDLEAMHSTWIEGMSLESVALALPSFLGTFGVGAFWLSTPGLERRGANRELLGTFGATSWAGMVSYSTTLDRTLLLGMNLKLIGEQLDDVAVSGVAVDFGGQWMGLTEGLTIGFALQHLGPAVQYLTDARALPTSIALGVAYQLPVGLLLAADWNYQPGDQFSALHIGTEVTPYGPLALRLGYSMTPGTPGQTVTMGSVPLPTGLVGGIGISLGSHSLDYAVVPVSGFGLTHRIGLRVEW